MICSICRNPAQKIVVPLGLVLRLGSPTLATAKAAITVELGGVCPACVDAMRRAPDLAERLAEAITRSVSEVNRADRRP